MEHSRYNDEVTFAISTIFYAVLTFKCNVKVVHNIAGALKNTSIAFSSTTVTPQSIIKMYINIQKNF